MQSIYIESFKLFPEPKTGEKNMGLKEKIVLLCYSTFMSYLMVYAVVEREQIYFRGKDFPNVDFHIVN